MLSLVADGSHDGSLCPLRSRLPSTPCFLPAERSPRPRHLSHWAPSQQSLSHLVRRIFRDLGKAKRNRAQNRLPTDSAIGFSCWSHHQNANTMACHRVHPQFVSERYTIASSTPSRTGDAALKTHESVDLSPTTATTPHCRACQGVDCRNSAIAQTKNGRDKSYPQNAPSLRASVSHRERLALRCSPGPL